MNNTNIIYIHSHDTGRYIQPYGYAVETPNMQRFAEESVLFRNNHCAAPTCSPSRAALLTGQYPHQNGMTALAHRGGQLNDKSKHLANYLKSHGYATAIAGVQHVTTPDKVLDLGYERILNKESEPSWIKDPESNNQWLAQSAANYILQSGTSKPFFLDCGFDLTHRHGTGEQWHTTRNAPAGDSRYVRPPAPLPDTPETRQDFADFRVAANLLDTCIGRVLDALELAGLANNTLVIITTDHGIAFPFMKCNLTGHGTGTSLMIRNPSINFTGGKVIDALTSHIDIFPTICEAADLPAPDWLEGHSLVPAVNEGKDIRDEIHAEVNWHAAVEPMRSIRTKIYNYIRRFDPQTHPILPNCDDSVSKTMLRNVGWDTHPTVAEELYDLIFDPNEACNRANDPAYAEILSDMQSRMQKWMVSTNDPLLTGQIEPWPAATVVKPEDESPQGIWVLAEPIYLSDSLV
jgi:N-sulfoglucosamine sulfohydrolase